MPYLREVFSFNQKINNKVIIKYNIIIENQEEKKRGKRN